MSSLGRDTKPGGRVRPAAGSFASRAGLLVLTLLLVLAGSVGAAPDAYAQDDAPIAVRLEALDPALPARDGTITLRGTAVNTSDRSVTAAQVVLWRHRSALSSPADLRAMTESAPADVWGEQLWVEGGYHRLTTDTEPEWKPGETRTFQVSARVDAFGFPQTTGAYLVGAQMVGRVVGRGLATVGQARTLVPLGATGTVATTDTNSVISAVVLSSQPSMIEPGIFADDHLAAELAPDGRLTTLLRAAERDQVSWLIDPSLLEEVTAMTAGYRVRTADGEQPGAGQEAATAWLGAYARLDPARGFRVPFALPDVSMLERSDLPSVLQHATAASQRVPGTQDLPLLAYATGGALDPNAIALAEQAAPIAILASGIDDPNAHSVLLEPIANAPLIGFSPAATAGGPGPDPSGSLVQVRQRMLAESFLTARGDPGATTVRVITSGEAAEADMLGDPPWLRRRTLTDLLKERPAAWSERLDYGDAQRGAELGDPQIRTLREIVRHYFTFASMLADPEAVNRIFDASVARAASSWWRGDSDGFDRQARPLAESAQHLWSGNSVELTAQRSVLMSGQSGSFPMTVTNHLNQPLRLTITFESFQPQRLSIAEITDVVVPANAGVTVNVQPQAVGNGPVRVSAQVVTPGGVPVSKRVWLTVEATNFGRVGWIIVLASGIVLIAATTLRIRQVRRERQAARQSEPDGRTPPPVVTIDRSAAAGEQPGRTSAESGQHTGRTSAESGGGGER